MDPMLAIRQKNCGGAIYHSLPTEATNLESMARKWPDRDEKMVKAMFNDFYNTMALYDLTRQWILNEGPFVCNFEWLAENYSQERADAWANNSFKQVFGVTLGDFEILPRP